MKNFRLVALLFTMFTITAAKGQSIAEQFYNDGISSLQLKDDEQAYQLFNKAIYEDSTFWKAHFLLGALYHYRGNTDSAIIQLTKAINFMQDKYETISLFGNTLDPFVERETIYKQLGKYDSALNDLNKSINYNSTNWLTYYERGNLYFQNLNNFQLAIQDYNKSLQISPDNSSVLYNLGNLAYDAGDYSICIKYFTNAINQNDPNNVFSCYYNRGKAKEKLNNYSDAINDFNFAIQIDPKNGSYYSERGLCYFKLGNKLSACNDFSKSCNLGDQTGCNNYNNNCK